MPRHTDTVAALATPAGTSALAVVRISGRDTTRLALDLLGRPPRPRQATHADYRDRAGALVDDVVVTFFAGPRSFTGEDSLEISCHGNSYIAQRILEDLLARGCRAAEPGEFTQRAFLNGRMDLSQAEAVMDVIHARSERALTSAQQQLRGSLGRRTNAMVESLLGILARVEAYIDFPDEDLPAEDRSSIRRDVEALRADTVRLQATEHYGRILRDGIRTVIVGEPNVGKSSLLNRLVGRDRALVSPEPGTTRDFIEERIMVGPHCIRLVDTAGLNPSPAPLERLGMEKTRQCIADADLLLLVADGSKDESAGFASLEEQARSIRTKFLKILNKSDLRGYQTAVSGIIQVSALTGNGIDELVESITEIADLWQSEVGSDAIAINARHAAALADASAALGTALIHLDESLSPELVASELRSALHAFGSIVGKLDNERMLDRLFASFCIGK